MRIDRQVVNDAEQPGIEFVDAPGKQRRGPGERLLHRLLRRLRVEPEAPAVRPQLSRPALIARRDGSRDHSRRHRRTRVDRQRLACHARMTLEHRLTFTRPSSAWERLLLGPGDHSHSLRRGCCSARRSRRPRAVPKRDRFDSARDLIHLHARRDRREKGFVWGRATLLTTGGLTCRFGHASPFTPHDHRLVRPCPRMRGALATERTSEPGGTKHHLGQSWAQVDPPSTVA
jgi:hypothetical protein